MVTITVLLYNRSSLFHFFTHIEAIIEDQAGNRSFNINYPVFDILNNHKKNAADLEFTKQNRGCSLGAVTLYSNANYDDFILNYYHQFGNSTEYNYVTHNCANAVNFALDFFFPDKSKTEVFYCLYKTLCCWLSLGACGIKCFPVPPGISSPNDVFKKAELLSCAYGSVPETNKKANTDCPCDEKLSRNQSCENGFSLAIINKEQNVILHFFEKHLAAFTPKQITYAYLCLIATRQDDLAALLKQKKLIDLNDAADEKHHYNYFFIPELLKHDYTPQQLLNLLMAGIKNNVELDFIKLICSYRSGRFISAHTTGIKGKFIKHYSLLELANLHNRRDILDYFLDKHFDQLTSLELGLAVLMEINLNDYTRAKAYLTKRPDILKDWSFINEGVGMHHLLASQPNADLELFKLLCETKPCVNLKLKTKAGETAMSIAIKNENAHIVKYLVIHYAESIPEQLSEAKDYLDKLDQQKDLNETDMYLADVPFEASRQAAFI